MDAIPARLLLAEGSGLADIVLTIPILIVISWLMLRLYRYQARQKRSGASLQSHRTSKETESRGLRAGAPDSIVRWEVEMQELARDLKAEIDSKMVALEELIRDADRAANRLEAAVNSAPSVGQDVRLEAAEPAARSDDSIRDEVHMLADYGFSANDIASRMGAPLEQVQVILRHREGRE